MIKKLFTLYKLGRKLAKSDVLNIVSKFKKPPLAITILFQILSFSFSSSGKNNLNENEGEKLSKSLPYSYYLGQLNQILFFHSFEQFLEMFFLHRLGSE